MAAHKTGEGEGGEYPIRNKWGHHINNISSAIEMKPEEGRERESPFSLPLVPKVTPRREGRESEGGFRGPSLSICDGHRGSAGPERAPPEVPKSAHTPPLMGGLGLGLREQKGR